MTSMTQKQLADAVGIKFQQIQKYETGANRVSASRLYEIADAMQVPVSFFFEDVDKADTEGKVSASPLDQDDAIPANLFNGKEAIELLNCYYRWPEEQRRRLFELTKSLTKESFAEAA
jgi:transcriptional regulator with XRE-family HTH domain